jgi:hypothetical protein
MSVDEWSVKRLDEQVEKTAKQLAAAESDPAASDEAAKQALGLRDRLERLKSRAEAKRAAQDAR